MAWFSARHDIVSIGDATTDIFLEIDDASVLCHLNKEECLLCIEYADKVAVSKFTEILGVGNAANNACGSARLGLKTALWAILGGDAMGKRTLTEVFKAEGVDTKYVELDREHGTNHSTVINFKGERTILVYHQPRTYTLPNLGPARWVYLTSMGKGWESIVPALVQYVKRTSARLAFNPGTHQLKSDSKTIDSVFGVTDLLFVNRDETHRILGTESGEPKDLLTGLRKRGPKTIVMTDGPEGAYAGNAEGQWFMPTIPAPVVERTGAGDSFGTAVTAALFYGKDLGEALRWGAANAASVIQHIGAREGLLTRQAMEQLLGQHTGIVARQLS